MTDILHTASDIHRWFDERGLDHYRSEGAPFDPSFVAMDLGNVAVGWPGYEEPLAEAVETVQAEQPAPVDVTSQAG